MTLANPESEEEFDIILGSALVDRITDVIYFPELKIDEAQQYVIELINNPQNRIESDQLNGLPRTYPFEETALKMLLEGMEKKPLEKLINDVEMPLTLLFATTSLLILEMV